MLTNYTRLVNTRLINLWFILEKPIFIYCPEDNSSLIQLFPSFLVFNKFRINFLKADLP